MTPPTNLTKFRIEPERMSWRDTLASNAWGLLCVLLIVLFGFGVVGLWRWLESLWMWAKGFI